MDINLLKYGGGKETTEISMSVLGVIRKGRPRQRGEGGLPNADATDNLCL